MHNKLALAIACCLVASAASGIPDVAYAKQSPALPAQKLVIPAAPVAHALRIFSQRYHTHLVYPAEVVKGLRSNAVPAGLSPNAAIRTLLEDTGLIYRFLNANTIAIYSSPNSDTPVSHASTTQTAAGEAEAPKKNKIKKSKKPTPTQLKPVVVTGTHIPGIRLAAPVIEITQQEMELAGHVDLGQVIRALPQNFGGGQNPGLKFGISDISSQDLSGGSALDLRGLGPDATLTLLNGRRLPFDGFNQSIDITQIPMVAVERLEVVPDGASAIYGSDAVGGVANVILKPDFQGLSTTVRAGTATSGGREFWQYDVVGGDRWSTGGFMGVAHYQRYTPIDAQQRDWASYLGSPYYLMPADTVKSVLFTGHQSLGAIANFRIDMLYNRRQGTVAYSEPERDILFNLHQSTYQYVISPTVSFDLPGNWGLEVNADIGNDSSDTNESFDSTTNGSFLFGGDNCYCNKARGWEVDLHGPVFRTSAGDVRAAFGAGYRQNSFHTTNIPETAGPPSPWYRRHNYYAFAQLFVPVVAPAQNVPLIHDLVVSAAARTERYNDGVGSITTPQIGVVYAPTYDFDLKGSWGKSFKAPTLDQIFSSRYLYVYQPFQLGGENVPSNALAMIVYGGNQNLEPERATTQSLTLDIHPRAVPNLQASLDYYHVVYKDRVIQPVGNFQLALVLPQYRDFIEQNPTLSEVMGWLNSIPNDSENYLYNGSGKPLIPDDITTIVHDLYENSASWKIHGIDISGSYKLYFGPESLTFRMDATRIASTEKTSQSASIFPLAGIIYNPPKWRSRVSLTFNRGPLTFQARYNYIGPVLNTTVTPSVMGSPMKTVDVSGFFRFGHGVSIVASVLNVGNARPPYILNLQEDFPNYDSTNYSPVGRFVSLSITKKW